MITLVQNVYVMKLKSLLISAILCAFTTLSYAQMSKEDAKIWKAKMKELDLESYKKLVEDKDEADANVTSLAADNTTLLANINTLKAQNAKLSTDVDDYKRAAKESADQLAAAKIKKDSVGNATGQKVDTYGMYSKGTSGGLTYKVQIGAFKNFDISKYFNNNQNFSGEIDDDGTKKYTIGEFKDYWEADKFKQFLREMGVKGAWVVAYNNGKRMNMKDAREGM